MQITTDVWNHGPEKIYVQKLIKFHTKINLSANITYNRLPQLHTIKNKNYVYV